MLPLKLDLGNQTGGWTWPTGSGLPTSDPGATNANGFLKSNFWGIWPKPGVCSDVCVEVTQLPQRLREEVPRVDLVACLSRRPVATAVVP